MARDTESGFDNNNADTIPLEGDNSDTNGSLHRRRYLKFVGTAAAAAATMTGVASADEDYDVIEVSAGESRTVRLDDGETYSNVLIDITAPNAKFHIRAIADNWEIRNIGFRGNWDSTEKEDAIICQVNSSNATGLIENVYFMGSENDDTYPGITGINVANGHAGDVEIRNVNLQNCPDNSIYASNPGDSSAHSVGAGGGGSVAIRNSYARNSRAGGFRIGTDGSIVENCVVVGCDKGFWGYYEHTEVKDSDISGCRHADLRCGDSHWAKGQRAEVTVTNTRYGSEDVRGAAVHGSSAGTPQRTEPDEIEGVPLSAEEAASGGTASPSPPDEGNEEEEDEIADGEGYLLSFVTDPDARYASYEFTADGPVEFTEAPNSSPSGRAIEGGTYTAEDFIDESGETANAGGTTGGGNGDAFRVDGPITSIDVEQPDVMWIELDGEEMSPEEVIEATSEEDEEEDDAAEYLLSFVTDPDASYASYEFMADGPVEFTEAPNSSPSGLAIEGGTYDAEDFIDENETSSHAGGTTGGGYGDAFRVEGPITSIDVEQPDVMWVELDGEEMSVEEVIEATAAEDEEEDESDGDHLLSFVTDSDTRYASYEFTADGPVEFTEAPNSSPSGRAIEGGTYTAEDFIDESGETVHAGGTTGGGYGDAFRVKGPITSIDIEQSDGMWVELDAEEMSVEEVVESTANGN